MAILKKYKIDTKSVKAESEKPTVNAKVNPIGAGRRSGPTDALVKNKQTNKGTRGNGTTLS